MISQTSFPSTTKQMALGSSVLTTGPGIPQLKAWEALVGVKGPELGGVDDAVHHPRHVNHPQRPGVDGVGLGGAPAVGAGLAVAAAAGERCR